MASESVGSIHWDLDLDDKKFKEGLNKSGKEAKNFGDRLHDAERGSQVFTAGIAAAGAAAVGFGIKSVQAFMESETALAQLDAVMKSTGNSAGFVKEVYTDLATELQNLTGVSDEAVLAGESMLMTFTNVKGAAFTGGTKAILDMATAMNGGLIPSAEQMRTTAMTVGKALNDPIEGLTRLTRVGVTFTDKQKEQIESLQKAGKTMEAQQVILAELNKEFGGSAEAAGKTFAGQLNIAKNTFGDFMELVGEGIVKSMRPLVESFNNWMQSIGGPAGLIELLTRKLTELRPLLPVITGFIIGGMVPALYGMAAGVWAVMAPLLPFIALGTAVGYIVKLLFEQFGGLSGTLAALQPILTTLGNIFSTFILPILQGIWEAVKLLWDSLVQLWNVLAPILMPVLKAIGVLIGGVLLVALMAFVGAVYVIVHALNGLVIVITTVINWVKALINWVWEINKNAYAAMANVGNAIISPFKQAFDWIKDKVRGVVDALKNLNPFTRHSPSLVDMVVKGTHAITKEYGNMFDSIGAMADNFRPAAQMNSIAPMSDAAIPSAPTPVMVQISAGAFMGTPGDAMDFAEFVRDEIIRLNRSRGE